MLSSIGGSDLRDAVRHLTRATIHPILLSEYNWTGRKTHVSSTQKLCFKELAITSVLTSEYHAYIYSQLHSKIS